MTTKVERVVDETGDRPMTKRERLNTMHGYTRLMWMQGYPQLDMDAPEVPNGYQVRPGVTFGCGVVCEKCYRPLETR